MSPEYSWDLSLLLEGKTLNYWIEKVSEFQNLLLEKYTDDLFLSRERLQEFHSLSREYDILLSRVKIYISNSKNTNLENPIWFKFQQELIQKSIPFEQKLSNFEARAIKHQKQINSYLDKNNSFQVFKRHYLTLFRYKNRRLSPTLNKFELTFAPTWGSYYELFNIISEREFLLEDIKKSNGECITVNNYATYIEYMKSGDSILRKNLFLKYRDFIYKKRESLFKLLYYQYLQLNIDAQNISFKRGYIESSLYCDELPWNFLPKLYKNMKTFRDLISKFKSLRRKLIAKTWGLENYERWDAYLELRRENDKKSEKKYSVEEAKEIVLSSLSVLGERYTASIKKIYESRWIDWLPRKGKISGAYFSDSCYKLPGKYILLNFNGYFDDVLTLAHELGHAVHDMEVDRLDTYYYSPTIFVAEIPSILNELLLNQHFLGKYRKEGKKMEQLFIYDHILNTFTSTAVAQLAYSEWEYYFNERLSKSEVIESEEAVKKYDELLSLYFGEPDPKEEKDPYILYRIFTIPHFYSGNFYVYKYAVGLLSSLLLSERIINPETREECLQKYYKFLAAGNSISNLESLELLSIFLDRRATWTKIRKMFQTWLREYERLAKELYGIINDE